ncbi:hypothetical protein [Actinoplanes lobatus]|uniref:Recombinase domain-containing protein n=1 Tax=Actinoplanes lobatus TaxID=113568 RepID=A0A7W7HL89_9ACTN|nr:hypothetical protein [Actinoplanes lobatus]MBB4752561.1 hypothetical protein [Actinoplanes lobatus]
MLNERRTLSPAAYDRVRNPHRDGAVWTLRTVAAILANPWYTDREAVPGDWRTSLGPVRVWNPREDWVVSPLHPRRLHGLRRLNTPRPAVRRGPPTAASHGLSHHLPSGRPARVNIQREGKVADAREDADENAHGHIDIAMLVSWRTSF